MTKGFTPGDSADVDGFESGAGVMIELDGGGLIAGDMMSVNEFGVVVRVTHRLTTRRSSADERAELEEEVGELDESVEITTTRMEELGRSVLSMIPWSRVELIELASDLEEDKDVRELRESLDDDEGGWVVLDAESNAEGENDA